MGGGHLIKFFPSYEQRRKRKRGGILERGGKGEKKSLVILRPFSSEDSSKGCMKRDI